MSKKLLLIGSTSKIAQDFIEQCCNTYELYGTYDNKIPKGLALKQSFKLDLADKKQVVGLLNKIENMKFDGVLFFASTYAPDQDDVENYIRQLEHDIQVNSMSILVMARSLHYAPDAKIFLFGDAGLHQPKKDFTSYSFSKSLLPSLSRILAIDLAGIAKVLTFNLGPTKPPLDHDDKEQYFSRNTTIVDNPSAGLIRYIRFIIDEDNLSMTGSSINFDGGAYLKRL